MKDVILGVPIQWYIYLSVTLFSIGVLGVLFRRNAIIIFMCIELMLNAVNLLMVAFSRYLGDSSGQVFVFFVMVVAAAETAPTMDAAPASGRMVIVVGKDRRVIVDSSVDATALARVLQVLERR